MARAPILQVIPANTAPEGTCRNCGGTLYKVPWRGATPNLVVVRADLDGTRAPVRGDLNDPGKEGRGMQHSAVCHRGVQHPGLRG